MLDAVWVTIKLATITTLMLFLIATPLAWWLSQGKGWFREVVNTFVALPLVLPPTVLGFYFLLLFAPNNGFGQWLDETFGLRLVFSFEGLVLGSLIYSLPFVVQPIRNAFMAIGRGPIEAAAACGASPLNRFFTLVLPLAKPGFIAGGVLGFAHTVGEFGLVLMIGGSVPDETRVLSVAIYEHVEALEWAQAHWLSGGMLLAAFVLIFLVNLSQGRQQGSYL